MKKVIIAFVVIIIFISSLAALSVYFYKERKNKELDEKLSTEQDLLLDSLGNGKLSLNDPYLNKTLDLNFKDNLSEINNSSDKAKYQIIDAIQPYNMDNSPEKEYPFIVKAEYTDKSFVYLLISHISGNKKTTVDLVNIGKSSQIEDIHRQGQEVLVDANIPTDQGTTEQAILSYTLNNDKIIPDNNNIDISKTIIVQKPAPVNVPVKQTDNSGSSGNIALTFDDGPGTYTPQILAALNQYGVKATFFEIGQNADAHPDYVKQILASGHILSDHTYTHPDLTKLSIDAQQDEISKAKQAIQNIAGTAITFFRPPYGAYNSDTDTIMPSLSLQKVLWNVDPRDWSGIPASSISQNVLANTKSGSVVLMHDGVANSVETAKALPTIIEGLRASGFKFVTLKEL